MMRSLYVAAVCTASLGLIGCGSPTADSPPPPRAAAGGADAGTEPQLGTFAREPIEAASVPAGLTPATPADQIVAAFLNALRTGDSGVAEALLTRQAREETRKRDLTVQQLGAPDATFVIGTTEYLNPEKTGAHVNTRWTEREGDRAIHYDIVWAVRRQEAGWRVAGMGAQLGPGQPIVYLNFEDPDDMLAKWRAADEAVAAAESANAEIRQAAVPQATAPIRR